MKAAAFVKLTVLPFALTSVRVSYHLASLPKRVVRLSPLASVWVAALLVNAACFSLTKSVS